MITILAACTEHPAVRHDPRRPPAEEELAPWTVAVWMDGDNDLEPWMLGDLNELERGASEGFTIVVQADRIDGHADGGGDWTGTRRIEIVHDEDPVPVSTVVEEVGEVNMGDGTALAEFLDWTAERYPSERLALVFWNHGGGFWIASDDTSGGEAIRIDDGELGDALAPIVERRGRPLDVVAFDACNMGQWEVAEALAGLADVMVASQAWVGYEGYAYDEVFPALAADADAVELGERLAWTAGVYNEELTHAAIDLREVPEVSAAVDVLAGTWLDAAAGVDDFVRAREEARGVDLQWDEFWLDLGTLADAAGASADPGVAAAGDDLRDALGASVIASYTDPRLSFASGLTVFSDTSYRSWLELYAAGPWAAETRWDELLGEVRAAGE